MTLPADPKRRPERMERSERHERTEVAQRFAALIREATGNAVPPARHAFLQEVAERRAAATHQPGVESYLDALAEGRLEREWEVVVSLVTIKESYFFRAPQQFEAILGHVLPRLLEARAPARSLRLWSAACARGEEPATLAMLLAGHPALAGWDWSILATDVDEDALAAARRGLYGERAVAQVPPELLTRWFARRGKLFELDPELRGRIEYRTLNLARAPYDLPFPEADLILLRNVLIYFRRPLQRWVASHVARALAPEGYVFLGASETLWQVQDELEAVDLGPCFSYRHRRREAPPATGLPMPVVAREPRRRPAATPAPVPPVPPAAPVRARPRPTLAPITPLAPKDAPPPSAPTPERLRTAAADLAANRVEEAARELAAILAADPGEPAAHALQGFLHDLAGRTEEAVAAYRGALYLAPALYQARLLLADCLLRLGQRDRAEHQYREVLAALDSGREQSLDFPDLPLPTPDRARRRCRQALRGG